MSTKHENIYEIVTLVAWCLAFPVELSVAEHEPDGALAVTYTAFAMLCAVMAAIKAYQLFKRLDK